jgi:Mg-chelatase subunit ChlD
MSTTVPPEFECPILLTTMDDPVLGDDGQTYQRSAIVHWLSDPRNQGRSPITRAPMRIDTLRPNFALKSQIERFLAQATASPQVPQPVPEAFMDQPLVLSASVTRDHVSVTVTPPAEGERQPVLLFALLDISGSTGSNSGAELEKGAADYTILDLCKHTARTVSGMLGPKDMLCLITYSSGAKVVLRPTFMDQSGQEKLDMILFPIKPEGNTNIWSALELMDRIASAPEFNNSNIAAALLTDGMSNMNPGRGVIEMFRLYGKPSLYNLSTFGFGYEIDSELLVSIANLSGGAFVFCPDFSMVATVFINWAATTLASAAKPKTVKVNFRDGSVATLNTGTIQFGQPRTFTMPRMGGDVESVTMGEQTVAPVEVEGLPVTEMARFDLINGLRELLATQGDLGPLAGLCEKYRGTPAETLMSEIKADGQVTLGTQKQAGASGQTPFWHRWGRHYIPAYLKAHELQQRMNFKDVGLQVYGSKNFEAIQTLGDHVFGKVIPFEPTGTKKQEYLSRGRAYHGAPPPLPLAPTTYGGGGGNPRTPPARFSQDENFASPMAYLTTPGAGCWAPGSQMKMEDGTRMPVEDLRRGDRVWTIAGPATVKYALKMGTVQKKQPMVRLANCTITPWHPVLDKMVWVYPADIGKVEDLPIQEVYNVILDGGHIVDVGGTLTVSLGHGFQGKVIEHAFFGSEARIIQAISAQPGFAEGRPVFENLKAIKQDGLIVGWYDEPRGDYSLETAVNWEDLEIGKEYLHGFDGILNEFTKFTVIDVKKIHSTIFVNGYAVGPWIEVPGGPRNRF